MGLPPRVRGNRVLARRTVSLLRPTPARAGQPTRTARPARRTRAYPRACGATRTAPQSQPKPQGLPPRVRGNPARPGAAREDAGPTPARAGQPRSSRRCSRRCWAYPRACGATPRQLVEWDVDCGLPPRVRGNLVGDLACHHRQGPTPARAGQPSLTAPARRPTRAYPRACGATVAHSASEAADQGLPPRVRGNRHLDVGLGEHAGPTPARAGQPGEDPDRHAGVPAYPRACGATYMSGLGASSGCGLPPRVRGNRRSTP